MAITEMLERNARSFPEKVAFVRLTPSTNTREEITWKEFDQRANQVANVLLSMGIQKGDRIFHLMMNSIDWIVVYFGILKSGAWVVPLNYRLNREDIENCAKVIEPAVFILGEEFEELVESARINLPTVEKFLLLGKNPPANMIHLTRQMKKMPIDVAEVEIANEDPCAVYLTSGTTGRPKCVVFTHRNLESIAVTSVVNRRLEEDEIFLILGPMYHAGSVMHWMGLLCRAGGAVILIDKKVTPQSILEVIDKEGITQLALYVPWLLDLFAAFDRGELRKQDYNLSSLRGMTIGAQPVPLSLTDRWKEVFPDVRYMEGYGLTEAGGAQGATVWIHEGIKKKQGMIGKAGFNCEARVVNGKGEDVPVGEVGEIVLRGSTVMKEYYKNPEETARALKKGWLYTGDMAKVDEEGLLYIVDRKKDVIICGGENIYPADVEAAMVTHPKVFDAALIGIPHERFGEIPMAIIEPKPGVTLTGDEMMEFCEQTLPRYRRPRKVVIEKVPRNPTGKIDKPLLRKMFPG